MTPADYIESWMGAKQGSSIHKLIVDSYNQIKPLPIGYKLSYSDSWCAGTISAAYHLAGLDNYFPSECSCTRMITKAKQMGIWVENDAYVPKRGDCIIYDWEDNGVGDCTGTPNHIGIVLKVTEPNIMVGEGNHGNTHIVGIRNIRINGRYIRGFVVPKISEMSNNNSSLLSLSQIAKEVIAGKWGNGAIRTQKLRLAGYNPALVQAEVNRILKK